MREALSSAEIARHLLIGERTVEFLMSNLLAKLDCATGSGRRCWRGRS